MAFNSLSIICYVFLLSTCTSIRFTGGQSVGEPDSGRILIKFLHRDHFMSPLSDPELNTLADRVSRAVERSHARRHSFGKLQNSVVETSGKAYSVSAVEAQVYSASGEYVMAGSLGTPPVDFVAIVDSGSDLIWLQCKQCRECLPQRDPLFDPTKSDTFKQLSCSNQFCKDLQPTNCSSTCSYVYSYGDGSNTRGVLASETATWTTTTGRAYPQTDMAFGCGLNNQGDFAGVDGLVGFGRGPLSLPSQIGTQVGRVFSYCLGDFTSATNQSSPLTIGKDPNEDISTFKFTPLIANDMFPTFYYIHLKSIRIGGYKLHIPHDIFSLDSSGNGGTIIDSGTTLTYLPQIAYDAVLNHLLTTVAYPVVQNTTSVGLDLCFDVSEIVNPTFPVVTFGFSGATLRMPTENTFITFDLEKTSLSCLAMASTEPGGFGVFGNYQQQNFQILYDLDSSVLGFKEKKCF